MLTGASPGTESLVVRLLTPLWVWTASLLPAWFPPNGVTLLGVVVVVVGGYLPLAVTLPLLAVDPTTLDPTAGTPDSWFRGGWVYVVTGAAVLSYQLLDAVDGIHARKTGRASALGELLDHSADSVAMIAVGLSFAACIQLGGGLLALAVNYAIYAKFFVAQWELKVTRRAAFGHVNSAGGLLLASGFFFWTALVGPSWWLAPLWGPTASVRALGLTLPAFVLRRQHAVAFVALAWCGISLALAFIRALTALSHEPEPRTRRKRIRAAAFHLIPALAAIAFSLTWAAYSPSGLLQHHPHVLIGLVGLLMSKLMSSMIVARLADQVFPSYHSMMLPLPFACFNSFAAYATGRPPLVPELGMLWTVNVVTALVYISFVAGVVEELQEHLGISFFDLNPVNPPAQAQAQDTPSHICTECHICNSTAMSTAAAAPTE